jgi:hypothetical protein
MGKWEHVETKGHLNVPGSVMLERLKHLGIGDSGFPGDGGVRNDPLVPCAILGFCRQFHESEP